MIETGASSMVLLQMEEKGEGLEKFGRTLGDEIDAHGGGAGFRSALA
jgi:hypothetical protein